MTDLLISQALTRLSKNKARLGLTERAFMDEVRLDYWRDSAPPQKGHCALTLIFSYSANDEPGAECEREKEEDRSQQQNRVPQLTYH